MTAADQPGRPAATPAASAGSGEGPHASEPWADPRHSALLVGRHLEVRAQLGAIAELLGDDGSVRTPLPDRALRLGSYGSLIRDGSAQAVLDGLAPLLESLPPGELGPAYAPSTARIGIIADRFYVQSLDGLADLVPVTLENYAELAPTLDVLLVVSTWRGHNDTSWRGLATEGSQRRRRLIEELIPAFRKLGVPVVFHSKEDPPNYDVFLPIAAHCDIVFTSAEEMIPRYMNDCPDASHYGVLPFGVNPLHHSPLGSRGNTTDLIFFAGSWMAAKYPSRNRHGAWLLDGIIAAGRRLALIDRNSANPDPRFAWPRKYLPFTAPARDHGELMRLQRITDVAINLNSVSGSQTMFANRALELQASGTMVLSTYSMGLNSHYPHVTLANSALDTRATLEHLTFEQMRGAQADGIRKVFTDDHAVHRLDTILRAAGIGTPDRGLTTIAVADEPGDRLRADMARQNAGPVRVYSTEEYRTERPTADIVLPVGNGHHYGTDYAGDHQAAFTYADARIVSKHTRDLRAGDEVSHRYLDRPGPIEASAWWVRGETEPLDFTRHAGRRIYGLDGFAVAPAVRDSVSIADARAKSTPPAPAPAAELTVVVPVYNNGEHLRHKCFASLLRSSVFDRMHVLLVDDGSTDPKTAETLDELEAAYGNVSAYRFPAGGSGSASRPRNKGLELAATEFVTYLDPDNEGVSDGYAVLLDLMKDKTAADFAIGNMTRWNTGFSRVSSGKSLTALLPEEDGYLVPQPDTLERFGFSHMSIQALVARTDWLRSLGIQQPVGAVGQDTYFFQQMIFYARRVLAVDHDVHTYYSAVSNSTVNAVSPKYFRKYLPLEEDRARWVREVGLLEAYRRVRLESFFKNWYLKKLKRVPDDQWLEAATVVAEIGRFYGEYEWTEPEVHEFWERLARAENENAGTP
ncbi:glycosyltransferase [Arthrobacter halodurans]|uniref:Glycosyltransferase n=1 Tax=Arthrobacter halodurans TaxID=516699 RepID=A0ABV4UJ41_9MICC